MGGRFTRVNGVTRVGLAAVNANTGVVDTGFVNNLSGGLGVNGAISVQRLLLTRDQTKLLVVHTGRQVAGQDRYGVALINTTTKQLLPWHTRLWEDNLQFVGGIQRAYGAAIAPDDSCFVVTSGSGGDRPPINDTAMAFPMNGGTTSSPGGSRAASTASTRSRSPSRPSTSVATSRGTSRRAPPTRGPAWTTWATAPARACRGTASATRWSTASTSGP